MFRKAALLVLAAALPLAAAQAPASAKDLNQMTWDEIVAQAKQEGNINWFHWYYQDRLREDVKAFEAEYGIKVTLSNGDYKANQDKLVAEKSRPEGDIDVMSIGGGALATFKPEDLFFGPLKPLLPKAASCATASKASTTRATPRPSGATRRPLPTTPPASRKPSFRARWTISSPS